MTNASIKMFDYRAELGAIRPRVLAAVERVLDSGSLILGPEVAAFESEMAEWLGGGIGVGVANGTDAIVVALWALGIGPGYWPLFTVGLVQRGYSDEDIQKILGGNMLRVCREVLGA